jgi:hypothetical protein
VGLRKAEGHMKTRDAITTTDFEEFYDRNEPDSAGELASLYRSVRDISDETLFETKEIKNRGNVTYHVVASSSIPSFLSHDSNAVE